MRVSVLPELSSIHLSKSSPTGAPSLDGITFRRFELTSRGSWPACTARSDAFAQLMSRIQPYIFSGTTVRYSSMLDHSTLSARMAVDARGGGDFD